MGIPPDYTVHEFQPCLLLTGVKTKKIDMHNNYGTAIECKSQCLKSALLDLFLSSVSADLGKQQGLEVTTAQPQSSR